MTLHSNGSHGGGISRRGFLTGLGLGMAAASLPIGIAFSPTARAGTAQHTIIYLFLRGGIDGLSLVPPTDGVDRGFYVDARDRTLIPVSGTNAALPLSAQFGLHPFCTDLHALFNEGRLAIVQGAGHPPGTFTRSHFDAQEQIELGTPGAQLANQGFLSKHLASTPLLDAEAVFTAMVSGSNPPVSLGGWPDVATLGSTSSFHPNSGTYGRTHLASLRALYPGLGELDLAARAAVDAVDLVNSLDLGNYTPGGGVVYPNTGLANSLRLVAQLIRQDLGLAVATLDFGGWDTHNSQNVLSETSGFGQRVRELSQALAAFYRDLAGAGRGNEVTIVVQSEFGRQVKENANFGTDHGLATPMLVLGGRVVGGLYGSFNGLAPAQRLGDSLVPTVDFRQVLATVIDRFAGNPNIDQVFADPGFSYVPMGFAP